MNIMIIMNQFEYVKMARWPTKQKFSSVLPSLWPGIGKARPLHLSCPEGNTWQTSDTPAPDLSPCISTQPTTTGKANV